MFPLRLTSMCVHYRIQNNRKTFAFAKQLADKTLCDAFDSGEFWPGKDGPVLARWREQKLLGKMEWGIYPARGNMARPLVNARMEALTAKATWSDQIQSHRCLIPADGFYEWSGTKGNRREVLFRLVDDEPFFFAGIWRKNPNGSSGYVIITCEPNRLPSIQLHGKMPVLLNAELGAEWLSLKRISHLDIYRICRPYPATKMLEAQ